MYTIVVLVMVVCAPEPDARCPIFGGPLTADRTCFAPHEYRSVTYRGLDEPEYAHLFLRNYKALLLIRVSR